MDEMTDLAYSPKDREIFARICLGSQTELFHSACRCETIGRATEWIHVISKARVDGKFPLRLRPTGALFRAFQALGAFWACRCTLQPRPFSYNNPHSNNDNDSVSIPSFLLPLISRSLLLTRVTPFSCIFYVPVFHSHSDSVHTHTRLLEYHLCT